MSIWMAYAMLTGALFSLAAWLVESAVRGRGGAARFVWLGAMVLTIALPCLAFLPQREAAIAPVTSVGSGIYVSMSHAVDATGAQPVPARDYDRALLAAWAMMSGMLALCLVAALVGLRVRRRGWRSANVSGIDVLVSHDAGPAAIGMIAPRIVLPEWSLEVDRRALTLMLEHEAEHVRARDPLFLAGIGVLLVAMPWNVALWWQAARLRQAMELDCDARVLQRHPDPQRYAAVLLDVARGESRWLLASPAMARHRSLERRIRLLVPRRVRARTASLAVAGAATLVVLACGVERPRPQIGTEPTPAEAPAPPAVDEAPPVPAEDAPPAPAEDAPPAPAEDAPVENAPPAPPEPRLAPPTLDEPAVPPPPAELDAPSPAEPPALPAPDLDPAPAFTPMTVRPTIRNRDAVAAAIRSQYTPVLRDAGIAGTAVVWMFIDESGRVQRSSIQRSSGHAALDEAALGVAQVIEFTPARNRDREVGVWLQLPIAFQAPAAEGSTPQ